MMTDRMIYYILADDGCTPVAIEDVNEWSRFFSSDRRIVKRDFVPGYMISTVFLGLDHGYDNGPPVLWETMMFERPIWSRTSGSDIESNRYRSYDEAVAGHDVIVGQASFHFVDDRRCGHGYIDRVERKRFQEALMTSFRSRPE